MKAADLFVKCLENEGVEYIFGLPGEENLHVLEAIRKSSIRLIVTRHEQAAAFMAATYGRLTGKVGVCLSTLGPGATNLVTGVAYAQLGGMPLLAITGQKAIRTNWQGNFQVLDVVQMMRPITKRSIQLKDSRNIPKEVRCAVKRATLERQGAVHIELPEDIANENVPEMFRPHRPLPLRRPQADPKAIRTAVEIIEESKRPLLIVSSRAQRHGAYRALEAFCEKTNIYVVHTQLGKGVLGDDHRNSLYAFGIHRHDLVNEAVDKADLLITVGYNTVEFPPSVWNQKLQKRILDINFSHGYQDIYNAPLWEVVGDIAHTLDEMRKQLDDWSYDASDLRELKKRLDRELFDEAMEEDALRPRRIVGDCREALDPGDFICLDNGIYKLWFARHYKTYRIGTFMVDNALASMGAGLPSAMATKLVHPERKVLCVTGDGGFMMNSQELETAVRLKLNVVVLILNDDGYGFIRWKQGAMGYEDFGLDTGNPDFVKYAEAYGATGYKIDEADELLPALKQAFKQDGPVVIECPIDYSENMRVFGSARKAEIGEGEPEPGLAAVVH